jgi:adenosylcobinamide amidohydrolase
MQIELLHRDEGGRRLPFLVVRLPDASTVISSAPVGGGFGGRTWVVNAQVPLGYDRTDLDRHIDELRAVAGLSPVGGVGMLTGAYVEGATRAAERGVQVVSTVGVSEPEWAAAPALARHAGPGTINVVAWVPARLSPSALVNAVATVTEAKTQALVEADLDGSGTATDAVCIACPSDGVEEPFGGPRSKWGHALAVATHATIRDGIANAEAAR